MNQILLCNQPLSAEAFQSQCSIGINQISASSCAAPRQLAAYTPYLVNSDNSTVSRDILNLLSPAPVAKELTNLSLSYGGDNVVALAEISAKLKDFNLGMIGASTSIYANRIGGFAGAVKDYQMALMEYRQAAVSNQAQKAVLKQKAHSSFNTMQAQFRNELNVVNEQVKSRRGTALTNPERATNIAKSSRSLAKLEVSNQIQAHNLVKLSKQAKFLGNGLAVIDFGSRVGNIHNSYQAGGNWERDLFIESSSFAASTIAGAAVVNAGSAALAILIVATPIGWIGLIAGGVAVIGVAAATSVGVNNAFKDNSGLWYDSIINSLGSR